MVSISKFLGICPLRLQFGLKLRLQLGLAVVLWLSPNMSCIRIYITHALISSWRCSVDVPKIELLHWSCWLPFQQNTVLGRLKDGMVCLWIEKAFWLCFLWMFKRPFERACVSRGSVRKGSVTLGSGDGYGQLTQAYSYRANLSLQISARAVGNSKSSVD